MSKHSKQKLQTKKIVAIIFFLIFFTLACFSGYKIVIWLIENNKNSEIIQEISNAVTVVEEEKTKTKKYNIDFKSLKEKNEDVVAWTKVNGTNIEFPIVKGNDNEFYLTHNLDKSYNSAGWAFIDYRNKLDGTDKNIVIYGHNRRDDSMFGTLKSILNEEWYESEENYIIPFITENEYTEYQVFSVYTIEAEDYYINTEFNSDAEYEQFLRTITKRTEKDFGLSVSSNDKILTFSTCSDNNKYRIVLHAKEIK